MSSPAPPPISVVDYESNPNPTSTTNANASQTKTALLVIDLQNDFVSGSLAVPDGGSVIKPINALLSLPFTLKIATRDFHPDNHVSFAKTHNQDEFSRKVIFHPEDQDAMNKASSSEVLGVEQVLWPIHCVAYTGGADFVEGLDKDKFDSVLHKGTHPSIESYSAFRDIWSRSVSDLPALLDQKGVTDVYIVGLAGDYCVKYTAIDAVEFGYKTWLVRDGIRSIDQRVTDQAYEALERKGAKVVTMKEVGKVFGVDLDV